MRSMIAGLVLLISVFGCQTQPDHAAKSSSNSGEPSKEQLCDTQKTSDATKMVQGCQAKGYACDFCLSTCAGESATDPFGRCSASKRPPSKPVKAVGNCGASNDATKAVRYCQEQGATCADCLQACAGEHAGDPFQRCKK